MSFEFFNTSHLAFGSKLTRAFRQLEKMCNDAELTIARFTKDVEYLGEYVNRNYRAPFPVSASSPVRADEIFDVINDEIIINDISCDDGVLTATINRFNRVNNRFTIGKGSTTLKKGYAFMSDSVSNLNPTAEIKFVESLEKGEGVQLFRYRVDSNGFINIVSDPDSLIKFNKGGIDHINNMELGDRVTLPYTAQDFECILVIGNMVDNGNSINVSVNGSLYYNHGGSHVKKYGVVYVKPNDVVSSSNYSEAYKIIYNRA